MNDRERRAAKYLPFDSLKGLKERILEEDLKQSRQHFSKLSEDEKLQMNSILMECYSHNKAITVFYFENGKILNYSGVIQRIDVLNRQIIFMPKKKFPMEIIYKIEQK